MESPKEFYLRSSCKPAMDPSMGSLKPMQAMQAKPEMQSLEPVGSMEASTELYIKEEFCIKLSMASIEGRPLSVTLARFDDQNNELIGCSPGFLALTGYTRQDVLGKNCRFLNEGSFVPHRLRERIRQSVQIGTPFLGVINNNRYLGCGQFEVFENLLHMVIIVAGTRRYILGIQSDVTGLNLNLVDGSQDALRLKKVFDSVLSAGVDSWIHIQEGMHHAPPTYLYIRHGGNKAWNDDEVEICDGDVRVGREPALPAPDQYLVLAPQFSPQWMPDDPLNFKFLLIGDSSPGWSGQGGVELRYLPKELNGITVLVNEEGRSWRSTNEFLASTANGLAYRKTKDMNDKVAGHGALAWGSARNGDDEGDGWVQVEEWTECLSENQECLPQKVTYSWKADQQEDDAQVKPPRTQEVPMPLVLNLASELQVGTTARVSTTSYGLFNDTSSAEPATVIGGSMKCQLQGLQNEDPYAILMVRGMSKLGLSSADLTTLLWSHFSRYGEVKSICIPLVNKKNRLGVPVSDQKRAPGRGFVIMSFAEDAVRVLSEGPDQLICGVMVTVGPFTAVQTGADMQ